MAAQDYTSVVQQLYISYFGRPADYFGLQNFSAQLDALGAPKTFAEVQAAVQADKAGTTGLSKLVNTFNNSAESAALYGTDNSQIGISKFVAAIYQNVLGREADVSGFNFWVNAITSGTLTKANAAAAITQAALTNTSAQGLLDAQTVTNKLSVATSFTAALDTPTEFNAYAGDAAAATGRSLLQGVSNTTDLTAYQANITDAISTIVNVAVPGNTAALTVGVDTLVGTAGDDVFNAVPQNASGDAANTLGAFDSIDGGAGKDTLNIYTEGTSNLVQQGTVKNVETINIYNQGTNTFGSTVANGVATPGTVDASKFVGATAVWQIGAAADIGGVGASTTAGFRAISAADLSVTGTAATVSVALDQIAGDDTNNVAALAVSGTKLTGVTVSGNLVDNADYTGSDAASLELTANVAKDAQTFTLNTAVNTTLVIAEDSTATKHVTTIAAGASTGNVTFDGSATGATTVTTITTGTGDDNVTLGSVLNATTKTATLNTGAGDDVIAVAVTGSLVNNAIVDSVTVDAGAGDDEITVTLNNNVKYSITGGAGNDTIILASGVVKTGDVIDGGDGTDTIGLAGKVSYVADDYLVYTKVLKNFEAIEFTSAAGTTTAFDASQVAGFKAFTFDAAGSITKVAADQAVSTDGATLNIQAAGYTAASATGAASSTVYSTDTLTGALTVEATGATSAITAKGASIALTVNAEDNAVAATLTGDVKTATVALANGVDADGDLYQASINVTTATTQATPAVIANPDATPPVAGSPASGAYTALGALTSLTITGDGSATVVNAAGTKLVTVDASALASVDADGDAAAGLTYTSSNASAETIKLGAGIDSVTLLASAYGGVGAAHTFDTVTGLNLVLNDQGNGLSTTSDKLIIGSTTMTAAKFTTTETDLDLALKAAAAANNADADHTTLVFSFGGDTYVMMDNGGSTGLIDATDTVVKLTGSINLDALVVALNKAIPA